MDTANRLLAAGLLGESGGEVDVDFYAMWLGASPGQISEGLDELARAGLLRAESRWKCSECDATTSSNQSSCADCGRLRAPDNAEFTVFLRPTKGASRDSAAVFLIHGMNTLGNWQQSLAWKIGLMSSYSIPVLVFKFGLDRFSPLTARSQRRRTKELGLALTAAQEDLRRVSRNNRCDVVAHSFGTLLVSQLLESKDFQHIQFGRIILTGSLVPQDFPWDELARAGRVEAVLNHRGNRDYWVRIAPYFFPGVGPSGAYGFKDSSSVQEYISPDFGHSDFFATPNLDQVTRQVWAVFLGTEALARASGPKGIGPSMVAWEKTSHRFWLGRFLLTGIMTVGLVTLLEAIVFLGQLAQSMLLRIGV